MNGDRIEMSQRERDRLKVMALVLPGNRVILNGEVGTVPCHRWLGGLLNRYHRQAA